MAKTRATRRLRTATWALLGVVAALNVVACLHARAMTTFTAGGARTPSPEDLGLGGWLDVVLTGVEIPRPTNDRTPADLGLGFTTLRFPNGLGDELEAWHLPADAEAEASAPEFVVIAFHGYADSKEGLLGFGAALHAMGVDALLVDFYGSGGSTGTGTTIGQREAADVVAALTFARGRWPGARFVLLGQSMGGAAILRAVAVEGARPDGLVLDSVFDRMVSTVGSRFRTMGLPARPLADLLVFWGGWWTGTDAGAHDPVAYARAVPCPALVMHGERDARVTREEALAVQEAMNAPSRFTEYPGARHGGLLRSDPERWRRDIEALLELVREQGRETEGSADLGKEER